MDYALTRHDVKSAFCSCNDLPQRTPVRSQEKKLAEMRRKSNTGKRSKTAAARLAASSARPAPTQASAPPATGESPIKGDKRAPVGTVGRGGGEESDTGIAPSLPLSALSDTMSLLPLPPQDLTRDDANSSHNKVQ